MARPATRIGRWTDRVEDLAAWVLLAAGLLVVMFGAVLGIGTHDRLIQQARAEALDRTPATATLLETAASSPSAYPVKSPVGVHATWQDSSGMTHTGIVTAPEGQDAGSTVAIWIDRSGAAVPSPISDALALGMAAITAGIVILGGMIVLAVLWQVLRRAMLAYNCAAWEREWREVGPTWSRGEGLRG
jgi:hypothetical protein